MAINPDLAILPRRLLAEPFQPVDVKVYAALSATRSFFVDDVVTSTGVGTRTVYEALRRLRAAGMLEVLERGAKGRRTRFRLPDLDAQELPLVS
jgi:predicted transcriptional regulator